MDLELRPSSDSGIDTIVDTEPGMRAPALNPVRLLGRADLPLSCELLTVHVGVVELLPETKKQHIHACHRLQPGQPKLFMCIVIKKALYLIVNVNFRMKILIGDTIFTFPTGDRSATLCGLMIQAM